MTTPSSEPTRRAPRLPSPGWMPDPARLDLERYWDGQRWTPRVRDRASQIEPFPVETGGHARRTRELGQESRRGERRGERRPGLRRERRKVNGLISSLLIALAIVVPAAGYLGALPTWFPWPDAWVQSTPTGPEVAYPVFGSDDLVLFLARSMVAQEDSINVMFVTVTPTGSIARVEDAMSEALTQNPYVFAAGYTIETNNGVTFVKPDYLYEDAEAERRRVATGTAVADLVATSGAASAGLDSEKAALLHDAIARTATYDVAAYDAINAGTTSGDSAEVARSQEAYGILVDHTAVCTGYAEAFLLAADAVGLRAVVVTGLANGGLTTGGHAWDRVWVDGAWRVVDVTWDDAGDGVGAEVAGGVRRDYFLLNAGDPMLDTRTADSEWVLDARMGDYA